VTARIVYYGIIFRFCYVKGLTFGLCNRLSQI